MKTKTSKSCYQQSHLISMFQLLRRCNAISLKYFDLEKIIVNKKMSRGVLNQGGIIPSLN